MSQFTGFDLQLAKGQFDVGSNFLSDICLVALLIGGPEDLEKCGSQWLRHAPTILM